MLAPGATAFAATSDVEVKGSAFNPSQLSVVPGDTVRWTFAGPDLNHSVTSDAGQAESFESDPGVPLPMHLAGDTFEHTFNTAGTFTYHCRVHSFMHGTVMVRAPGSAPPPPAADTTPPAVSSLRVRAGRTCRGKPSTCRKRPTTVSWSLSEPASVRMTFKRSRGKSPRPLSVSGVSGSNSRRLSTRRVPPGRYRLTLRATDAAGNHSTAAVTTFRVR